MTARKSFYLGLTAADLGSSPYARFYRPQMAPLPEHVRDALLTGAVAHELMPDADRAAKLHDAGYWEIETGYTLAPDGSGRVFALTQMPNVTPAMWDWWFGWHGSEAQRYKLWHPRAHVHAAWQDSESDPMRYIGRTSLVVEYIGALRLNLSIRFVPPAMLGLDEALLREKGEVAICARGGLAGTPFETGWLIHHIRPVNGGCEMRSRFWIGGKHVRLRNSKRAESNCPEKLIGRLAAQNASAAADLLVHCAQEMNHLAGFLPELFFTFGPETNYGPR